MTQKYKNIRFPQPTGSNLKIECVNMWLRENLEYYITLSFNRCFNFENGVGGVDKFFRLLLQGVHGQRWHKRNHREKDFLAVGFCEFKGTNVHYHLGISGEPDEIEYLRQNADAKWRSLYPQGDCSTEKIRDIFAAAEYSFKTIEHRDCQERLYVYVFPDQMNINKSTKRPRRMSKEERRALIWSNKQESAMRLHCGINDTKKNRGKKARYGIVQKNKP